MARGSFLSPEDVRRLRELTTKVDHLINEGRFGKGQHVERASEVYLIRVPCGEYIPAAFGISPGTLECCLYKMTNTGDIESPTYEIEKVTYPNGDNVRVEVHNVHEAIVPAGTYYEIRQQKFGRWLVEYPSRGSSASTTTTTSANINVPNPGCGGRCRWTWNAAGNSWTLTDDECENNIGSTTTSSTTTTACDCPSNTTTSSTTTTTTTAGGTTSSTTTTTSTSAGPGGPCRCVPPTFCGSDNGECTFTYCHTDPPPENPSCSSGATTTTPDGEPCDCSTSTTQTTTTSEGQEGEAAKCSGCTWVNVPLFGWVASEVNCSGTVCSDSCPAPQFFEGWLEANPCSVWINRCLPLGYDPPPSPVPCGGRCEFICTSRTGDPEVGEWFFFKGDCNAITSPGCKCVAPTGGCACGATVISNCSDQSGTTTTPDGDGDGGCAAACESGSTTSTSTSTTPPNNCDGGHCKWSASGETWVLEENRCGECACDEPPTPPEEECQVTWSACTRETTTSAPTTTTSTTTTTTTTAGNCCEAIPDEWIGFFCEDTNLPFTKTSDYVWEASETLSCGDAISVVITCNHDSPDSGPEPGNCNDRFDVVLTLPCAVGLSYSISSCSCDDTPVAITGTWGPGSTCLCCGGGTTSPGEGTTTSTTTTTTTSSGCGGNCEWAWTTGTWTLTLNSCTGGAGCSCDTEPGFPGEFEGHTVFVDCA
jgi:hypothetical protein